jgi:hypothetical protein
MARTDNFRQWAGALFVTSLIPVMSFAHPLEDAAQQALSSCLRMEIFSLDECGTMSGRSAAHSEARKAVMRLYESRSAFMSGCGKSLVECQNMADWHIGAGMARVLNGPVVHLDRIPQEARR